MNQGRAVVSVTAAGMMALLWLLLPGDWRGLAVLPFFCWWAAWVKLGEHYHALHELDRELNYQEGELYDDEDQADELDDDRGDWSMTDEEADPVNYYAMLARRYAVEQQWQQRGPDDTGPHLLAAPVPVGVLQPMRGPVPITGGPAAAESDTGEAGPPALDGCTCTAPRGAHRPPCVWATQVIGPSFDPDGPGYELAAPIELDHTAELDDQADELDPDAWPDPYDLAAATLLAQTRAEFDLLRRMFL